VSETANRGGDQGLHANLVDVYGTYQQWSDEDGPSAVDGFTRANDAVRGALERIDGRDSDSGSTGLTSVAGRLAAVLRAGEDPGGSLTSRGSSGPGDEAPCSCGSPNSADGRRCGCGSSNSAGGGPCGCSVSACGGPCGCLSTDGTGCGCLSGDGGSCGCSPADRTPCDGVSGDGGLSGCSSADGEFSDSSCARGSVVTGARAGAPVRAGTTGDA
jgi:hypothetical protein